MHVITLEVAELGNRCHLVHDGAVALVVDPPRDLGPVERAAEEAGVEIAAVADTHVHNDYLSGALGLARRHGADYLLSAAERVDFERVGVRDGEVVRVGQPRRPRARHPGPHPPPPVVPRLPRDGRQPAPRSAVQRREPPERHRRADRPRRRAADASTWRARSGPAPAGSAPWTRPRGCTPRTGSGASARAARAHGRTAALSIGDQRASNPALTAGPRGVRRRARGGLRPGPRLLPRTWPR